MNRPAVSRRLGRPFGAALLTLGLLGQVGATTFSALTLTQQARKADVIVQATIGTPSTVTEGNQSYSVYPLKVSETLAGDAAQLPQVSGGPALYVLSGMDQAPVFQSGQEAVLLLYKGRLDSPLVGFNQGAYLVSAGGVSVLPVAGAPQPSPVSPDGAVTSGGPTSPQTTPPQTTPPQTTPPGASSAPTGTGAAAPSGGAQAGSGSGGTATTGTGTGATTGATSGTTPPTPAPPSPAQGAPTPPSGTPATGQPSQAAVPAAAGAAPVTPGTTPAATPAPPPGVLGSIRTVAQLKAALVAARAGK